MQSFHKLYRLEHLTKKDFRLFYASFRKILEEKLPSFEELHFLFNEDEIAGIVKSDVVASYITSCSTTDPCEEKYACVDNHLIFTFPAGTDTAIAVFAGIDEYFSQHVSKEWLRNTAQACHREFILVKKAGTDFDSGLLNSLQFYMQLEALSNVISPAAVLIEVYPKSRSAQEAKMHVVKTARSLEACVGGSVPLFYLGDYAFALLSSWKIRVNLQRIAEKIVLRLKREGFSSVQIGLRLPTMDEIEGCQSTDGKTIAVQLWNALQAARKKGPYALCNYEQLMKPESHPLPKPSKSILSKLGRKWRDCSSFSLIQLQPASEVQLQTLLTHFARNSMIVDGYDIYLLLKHFGPDEAKQWIAGELDDLKLTNVLVGIAYYPHLTFSKSSTVHNCRKAVREAAFYGPDGIAVFDAVSLNVSGDIYYAEGDLRAAIKEYRTGLLCNPENKNLLNSLGVAYADIGRHREAQKCFESVLNYSPDDFMALYNSGLGAELNNRVAQAIDFYERASAASSDFPEAFDDLKYHLGRLYCVVGKFPEALEMLRSWYNGGNLESGMRGRALAYLGQAYYGLGEYDQAVTWLQKALRFDQYDAESMGLLGNIYLLKGEGDDIALSLCTKSVDFEPDNLRLKLHLARAQIACGRYMESRETIKGCLRKKETKNEAQLLACMSYAEEGSAGKALVWLKKVLAEGGLDKTTSRQVKILKQKLKGIRRNEGKTKSFARA